MSDPKLHGGLVGPSPDHAAQHLAAIVTSSDDAIISKNLDGVVTSWNRGAQRLFGYVAAEMIGQSIRRIIPEDRQHEEDDTLARIRCGDMVDHFETWRVRKDGTLVPISLTVSPILDGDRQVVGASKIARDITDRLRSDQEHARLMAATDEHAAVTQKLNQVGKALASTLDPQVVVQAVTDAATDLTTAEFGAFFYNVADHTSQGSYMLYALSGAPKAAFAKFPHPRATSLFGPTFRGEGIVRLDDVQADSRFGQNPPYDGLPTGHLPVRSYLAVPVMGRGEEVLGGLFFGHSHVGVFAEKHERLAAGIAVWASVALENARLYATAREASRLKDEFLATLSHELRTPLNAIVGYARMMRRGLVVGEKLQQALETVDRNATSLTQIVEDILDVSRIINGKIRLNVQPVDLPLVVREALETVRPAAEARGIRLESVLDPRSGPVSGDPERLQQVVWNLVSNAVKFTARGGKVQVRVERVNSHVEVAVSDTGIGIEPDFLPHVFERFRQADSRITRERGGLGLGLAIVRHIVELHGGAVRVSSPGKNQGTTFLVDLPLMIVHSEPGGLIREHPRGGSAVPDPPMPNLRGIRVLAVDDDKDALQLVREILEAVGAEVYTTDSAVRALDMLAAVEPNVLLADLGMPQMDGFELIHRVRSMAAPAVRDMPAAALTAFARSEDRAKALQAGFELHLSKPIEPVELMAAVFALSRRRRQ